MILKSFALAGNNGLHNEVLAHMTGKKSLHFREQVAMLLLKKPITSTIICRLVSAPMANYMQTNRILKKKFISKEFLTGI